MDIQPTPHLIDSIRKQGLAWSIILGEFIDNAFDAGANRVEIDFTPKRLKIADNGDGCDNLSLFLTMGKREQKKSTQLGRYGIGVKDAAISAADKIEIVSIHKGTQRVLGCDWRKLERQSTWTIADEVVTPCNLPNGTIITLSSVRSADVLKGKRKSDLVKRLSLQYTPATRQGLQIIFNGQPVQEYRFPPLEQQKSRDLEINGRKARVMMGLIPEGVTVEESGLVIACAFRVIEKSQRLGLGDKPTPGLFGWVDLEKGWELAKNKDKTLSADYDLLGEAIHTEFRDIIERAARRGMLIRLDHVSERISQLLMEITGTGTAPRKAKRSSAKQETGPVLPMNTERRHTRAAHSQPGNSFTEAIKQSNGLTVAYEPYGETGPLATYSGNVIYLNKDLEIFAENPERTAMLIAVSIAAFRIGLDNKIQSEIWPEICEAQSDGFDRAMAIAGHFFSRIQQKSNEEAATA